MKLKLHKMNGTGDIKIQQEITKFCDNCIVVDIDRSIEHHKEPVPLPGNMKIRAVRENMQDNQSRSPNRRGVTFSETLFHQRLNEGQPVYDQAPPPRPVASWGGFRLRNSDQYEYSRSVLIFRTSFENQSVRSKFIQHVYTILAIQLSCTCGFLFLSMYEPNVQLMIRNGRLATVAICTFLFVYFTLVCSIQARRRFPHNLILLAIFTLAMSYTLAIIAVTYETKIILMSMAMTAAITVVVSVTACQTSYDCTRCLPFLCMTTLLTLIFGIVLVITAVAIKIPVINGVYSVLICFVFILYLIFDTQMIMGGRRIELFPEEYIYGALSLYADIMYIVINLLRMFYCVRMLNDNCTDDENILI